MSFKSRHPDFAAIERHIRQARAERAVLIATLCADAIMAAGRGLRRLASAAAPALKRGARGALVVKASVPRPAAR
jgi:hypothetical protein